MITSNTRNVFISPAIIFTYDALKSGFTRNCILDTLQGESINIEAFQEFVIRNIEKKDKLDKGNNTSSLHENKYLNGNWNNLSNAEILEQQRRDMESILKEEEKQKRLKTEQEEIIKKEVL